MADPSRYPDAAEGADADSGRGVPPRTPRWVKVSGIVVGVLILLVVIVMLTGLGGGHGPGRHMGAGSTLPISVTAIQTSTAGVSR